MLRLSKIFDWYGDDFISQYGKEGGGNDKESAVRGFFAHFLGIAMPSDTKIEWREYDWRLNGKCSQM